MVCRRGVQQFAFGGLPEGACRRNGLIIVLYSVGNMLKKSNSNRRVAQLQFLRETFCKLCVCQPSSLSWSLRLIGQDCYCVRTPFVLRALSDNALAVMQGGQLVSGRLGSAIPGFGEIG